MSQIKNIPDELKVMAEALVRTAHKHKFKLEGCLFNSNAIMAVRTGKADEDVPAIWRALADLFSEKKRTGSVQAHKVSEPS